MPRRATLCLSAGGSTSAIRIRISTAPSTSPRSTDDGLATELPKPTGTSFRPTRRSSPIHYPVSICRHTPSISTSAFTSSSITRRWQLRFVPPRPMTSLLSSRDKRSTETVSPYYHFFAAKRDPTTYTGPGDGAVGWKLFAMHWKLLFWTCMNDSPGVFCLTPC